MHALVNFVSYVHNRTSFHMCTIDHSELNSESKWHKRNKASYWWNMCSFKKLHTFSVKKQKLSICNPQEFSRQIYLHRQNNKQLANFTWDYSNSDCTVLDIDSYPNRITSFFILIPNRYFQLASISYSHVQISNHTCAGSCYFACAYLLPVPYELIATTLPISRT